MPHWIPVFTLPNVFVKEPVEVEYVALVSPDDPPLPSNRKDEQELQKVREVVHRCIQAEGYSERYSPTGRRPSMVKSYEAIGGFRDAISLSAVVHNRTNTILYDNARSNQYSTFFEFYAWNLSKDFNLLVTNNQPVAGASLGARP